MPDRPGSRPDGALEPHEPKERHVLIRKYLKHSFSCLPDAQFEIDIDDASRVVTITSKAMDSYLLSRLVTQILPDEHGIVAYRDDDAAWLAPPLPYALRVRIGGPRGIELGAQVVRLAGALGGALSVRLSELPAKGV